jgi:hypothetical protein
MSRSGRQPNPLAKSLDCSLEKKDSILATVHLLQQSMVLSDDLTRRASFDGGDLSVSSDTDSVSSGSNSGVHEFSLPPRAKATSRGRFGDIVSFDPVTLIPITCPICFKHLILLYQVGQ